MVTAYFLAEKQGNRKDLARLNSKKQLYFAL